MTNPNTSQEPIKMIEPVDPAELTKEELVAFGKVAEIADKYFTAPTKVTSEEAPRLPEGVDSKYATSNLGIVLSDTVPALDDRAGYAQHVQEVSQQATNAAILRFKKPESR